MSASSDPASSFLVTVAGLRATRWDCLLTSSVSTAPSDWSARPQSGARSTSSGRVLTWTFSPGTTSFSRPAVGAVRLTTGRKSLDWFRWVQLEIIIQLSGGVGVNLCSTVTSVSTTWSVTRTNTVAPMASVLT